MQSASRRRLWDYLNEKYDDAPTQELLDMASVLDPRFKLTYVSEDRRGSIEERLSSEMKTVMVIIIIIMIIITITILWY